MQIAKFKLLKSGLSIALLTLWIAGSSFAQTKAAPKKGTPPAKSAKPSSPPHVARAADGDAAAAEQDIVDLEKHLFDYARDKNTKDMEPWIADDFTFSDANGKEMTRDQYLAQIKSNPGNIDFFGADNLRVRVYGSVAVVTGKLQRTISQGDVDMIAKANDSRPTDKMTSAFTDVFRRRGSDWELVQQFLGVISEQAQNSAPAADAVPPTAAGEKPKAKSGDDAPPRMTRPSAPNPPETR